MKGSLTDESHKFVQIMLTICIESQDQECASKDELREYFKSKSIMVFSLANYIDLHTVLDED